MVGTVKYLGRGDSVPGDPADPVAHFLDSLKTKAVANLFDRYLDSLVTSGDYDVVVVEICNNSRYQLDWVSWNVWGYIRGHSSAHSIILRRESNSSSQPTEMWTRDRIISAGECVMLREHGNLLTSYDSNAIEIVRIRLTETPW